MGVFEKKKKRKTLGVSKHCCFSLFCSHPSLSAVTRTIISCYTRSRSRGTSLESKTIASTVCRCPISSFSFSSVPNSLKEDETARSKSIFTNLTSLQSIYPSREPENSVKAPYKAITHPFIFYFKTSRSIGGHTAKRTLGSRLRIVRQFTRENF